MTKKETILGVIFFDLAWWLCVLSGALNSLNHPVLAHVYLLALALSFFYCRICNFSLKEMLFGFILSTVGALSDSLLIWFDYFHFSTHLISITGLPYWLLVLWFSFSLWFIKTDWLNRSYKNTVIFFFFGGPIGYYGAYKLNALFFSGNFYVVMTLIALTWFLLGTLFFILSQKFFKILSS